MQVYAEKLRLPEGFGANWDALFDVLCDLSWIAQRRIVLEHESLPKLPPLELEKYLRVLRDSEESWQGDSDDRELIVRIPGETEEGITK